MKKCKYLIGIGKNLINKYKRLQPKHREEFIIEKHFDGNYPTDENTFSQTEQMYIDALT
tara:strand:- start:11 stop:187 length:177 start_codon:yes stop_codon:yes gene_type:complete